MTVVLALLQSLGIIVSSNTLFGNVGVKDYFGNLTPGKISIVVLTLTAGTALIMWLGELITQRGVGNGMSILIFAAIISRLPAEGSSMWAGSGKVRATIFFALGLLIIVAVVLVEQAQRRIPVQYAKRVVGRKMYGGTSTYIPLKVNQAGVIPIIFASSLLYLPVLASTIITNKHFQNFVNNYLNRQNGANPYYIGIYFLLIIFFTYFYTSITFNPLDVADNMKKYGGFVPGIRPGRPTAEYLDHILTRITLPGSLFLGLIAVIPFIYQGITNTGASTFPFAGTSILIIVGVALETMKQIESQLMMRHYEGFLK
jgi:preprotein translocase subunit SecY